MSEYIKVTKTNQNFDYWRSRPYLTDETKSEINDANLLIVPFEDFREGLGPVFIKGSLGLLRAFQKNANDEFRPELCIEDSDYREIELNSSSTDLGIFIATNVVLPTALAVIYDLIKTKFSKPKKTDIVKLELLEQDEKGRVRSIKFEGPVEFFQPSMDKAIEIPFEEVDNDNPNRGTHEVRGD